MHFKAKCVLSHTQCHFRVTVIDLTYCGAGWIIIRYNPYVEENMGFRIAKVERGGLADELGLRKGDELLEINGEKLIDLIDYQQLMSCEDLVLTVRDRTGEVYEVECDKDMDEELGADFEGDMLGSTRLCANKCLFCFVDQLPKNMRSSLYVKDDDWRMSLMMGNYVTMTNVGDRELDRIISRHASPLYISVHATDGPLRAKLLGQPRGANLMDQLNKLAAGGIQFHGQAVLCPGINDGPVLEKTVRDMAALYPACITLALVPVGLTGHRAGLCNLKLYDRETANKLLDEVEKWQKEFRRTLGTALVFAADEFYVLAERDVPPDEEYEDYPQIDNGIGLIRFQREGVRRAYDEYMQSGKKPKARRVAIITGVSAKNEMQYLVDTYKFEGVDVSVHAVRNDFFGPSVTVAGLVTGGDIIKQYGDLKVDEVLIPRVMLRDGGDVFLDNVPRTELEKRLGCPVTPVYTDGEELVKALAGEDLNG